MAVDPAELAREAERLSAAPPVPETAPSPAVTPSSPPPQGSLLRRLSRASAIDVGPLLRHRDYRLLFIGQLVSFFGSMLTYVALPYQVFSLTRSSLAVGLLGLVELAPLLGAAFVGGALADARDRRLMVQLTEIGLTASSALLLVNALLPRPQLWLLYVIAGLMAGLGGLQRPSLEAMVPRLVERHELPATSALASLRSNIGMIGGEHNRES